FGLITTNSITQTFNRQVVASHISRGTAFVFAIPDHPWVDSSDGAAVRIAMTVASRGGSVGILATVSGEFPGDEHGTGVELSPQKAVIHADLTIGANVTDVSALQANRDLSFQGIIPLGDGFRLTREDFPRLGVNPSRLPLAVRRFVIGKDLVQVPQERHLIDFFGLTEEEARSRFPALFQHVLTTVKPERDHNRRDTRRKNWWLFGENAPKLRRATRSLARTICTVETSKHKPFVFLPADWDFDHKLYVVASDDAFFLGVLSSRIHGTWALAAGGRLGVGNDPTWTNTTCFLPFPFPATNEPTKTRIRKLAESLDAHRKAQQAAHPGLTVTGMYNVLEKLRSGDSLTAKEKTIHEQGLVSVLRQLHDDLDAAVFDAYGWPHDLTDEQILERLVKLNAERAAEEARGLVRWLRPEFQAVGEKRKPAQVSLLPVGEAPEAPAGKGKKPARMPWPKAFPEQIAAIRNLLAQGDGVSVKTAAAAFNRADKEDLAASLDALVALGLAVAFEVAGERRWRLAGRVAA
ncbi:MAG TPA: type IIL restriction-modification enzyme MmeI, partial [Anaeromyxobacter sp.]